MKCNYLSVSRKTKHIQKKVNNTVKIINRYSNIYGHQTKKNTLSSLYGVNKYVKR